MKHGYTGSPYSPGVMEDVVTSLPTMHIATAGDLDSLWAAFFATGDTQYLMGLVIDPDDELGTYSARVELTDRVSQKKMVLEQQFKAIEGPRADIP